MSIAVTDRAQRGAEWMRHKAHWIGDRPWAMVVILALFGLGVRHAWLSTDPLSAGDWHWPDNPVLANYSPWPGVWDASLGLGGENRFSAAFRFPIYAVAGLFAVLGAGWTVTEKLLYFVPFAVLLPVGGWLLAREIMGRTKWALLTPVLLVGATYFLLESNGEVPLALGEVISFFVLIAFLKTVRQLSFRWALITGLLLSVVALYDIRPAYLCLLLMAMYFVIIAVMDRNWQIFLRRTALGAAAGVVFIGIQAFWLVPLLTYHGGIGLPIPQAPNFNIITLAHGIAGVDAFWTGGTPAQLVQSPLNPAFMILPLIALTPILARRMRPEVLWLLVAALLFAFFAKTDNAPFGGIYDWMYLHFPGWKLFREGSKFLYIVTLAYAILIPMALASAFEWSAAHRPAPRARMLRGAAALALVGVVALSGWSVFVLQSGALGSTTQPTPEPASFVALSKVLADDPRPGPVLWFGQPLIGNDIHNHHFLIASPAHPAVNLTGKFAGSRTNQRDPFQLYCPDNVIPYCYVDSTLFPYLVQMAGAGYIVVPGGQGEGSLPAGITRAWLQQQMTQMFGSPMILGSGSTSIWVWRMSSPQPAVTTAPAVAEVDSGTWATTETLPALEALDIPAAYRESFDSSQYPVAPANLPDSVAVMPYVNNTCIAESAGTAAVMAQTSAPSIQVTVDGSPLALPSLTSQGLARTPGWSVYGPFPVKNGTNTITSAASTTATGSALTLGPCLSWSSLTATALGAHTTAVSAITLTSSDEQITASTDSVNGTWVELRRYYDPGWRLDTHKPISLGDGLFNLYHLDSAQSSAPTLSFQYSTLPFERIGQGIAVIALIATVWLIVRVPRRLRFAGWATPAPIVGATFSPSRAATWVGAVGMGMLAVTAVAITLEWFGVPSILPVVAVAPDPYSVDIGYGGVAIALLLLSLAIRFVVGIFGNRNDPPSDQREEPHAPEPEPAVRRTPTHVGAGVASVAVALVLASCGQSASDFQNLISQAQQAGAVAPSILGSSLDDARLQRAARQPDLCVDDYTQALQEFPTDVAAYVGRGDCYLNGGQNGAAAVHDYAEAISLAPSNPDLYLRRAVAYRVIGNLAAATADYKTAALIPSANAGQQLTAIDGLVAISDYPDAQTVYQRAQLLDPGTSLLYVAGGDLATAMGNQTLANQDYALALADASSKAENTQVLSHECQSEVLDHEYTLALTDCASAATNSSSGSGAYDDLAEANLAVGNPGAALTGINSAIANFIGNANAYTQTAGVDGFGLSNLLAAKGWIQIQLGQTQAAVATFNEGLNALPGSAPDTRARIKAYIETAKKDEG